jgi:hypothetical protein
MSTVITAGNATNGLSLSADNAGAFEFKTGAGAGTTAMTINSSQNVGIGTTSPSTYGKLAVVAPASQYCAAYLAANTSGTYYHTSFYNNTTQIGYQYSEGTNFGLAAVGASAGIVFLTNGSERMRIDSSGNVLVGTTTALPGYLNSTTGSSIDSGGTASFSKTGNVTMTVNNNTSGNQLIWFAYQGITKGNIALIGTTGVSYNSTSDYRLKENVQPMVGALDKVAQLKPCTYKWKSDGSNGQGFIAHELAEVVPDCVTGEKDEVNEDGSIKPQGIDTSFLVATLTAAIQEQQLMIQELSAKVAALEAR